MKIYEYLIKENGEVLLYKTFDHDNDFDFLQKINWYEIGGLVFYSPKMLSNKQINSFKSLMDNFEKTAMSELSCIMKDCFEYLT